MFEFGADNWIKYGWGSELKDDWFKGADLVIDFTNGGKPIEKMPALRAAWKAIDHIVANYPAPYTLMCSGGVDSQAMMWAWHTSGHPFEVVSIKYVTGGVWYNDHDLVTLELFTKRHNIPVTYREFDVIDFLENGELQKYAKEYDCHSPQITAYMKMSELISDGTVLFSGNYLRSDYAKSYLNYTILGLNRYSVISDTGNRKLIPFFLNFTPSLAYSFGNLPITSHGFSVLTDIPKFTGFENIKIYYDNYKSRLTTKNRLSALNRESSRVFDLLFRYSLEDMRKVDLARVTTKTTGI